MRTILSRISLLATLLAVACTSLAQHRFVKEGDKAYEALAYVRAIRAYERAAENAVPDPSYAGKLADCYLKIRNFKQAEVWYARAVLFPGSKPEDHYNYAQCLRANGKYAEADTQMARYRQLASGDSRVERQDASLRYAAELLENSLSGTEVRNLGINTAGSEMGPSYLNSSTMVFASDRAPQVSEARSHTWNGRPFLDLYTAPVSSGQVGAPTLLEGVNTRFHESNATFSPKGDTIYFTRNNFHNGRKGRNGEGVITLEIYSRTKANGDWVNEAPFPFNNDAFSVGHPCLSPDGRTMYFTSDMPGGHGGTDIWRTTRQGAGWSKPECLGTDVNTEGLEMFPYVGSAGVFAFASDGHTGLGGLDILIGQVRPDGSVGSVRNPGAPLNSGNDDFGLLLDANGQTGYFTSDRPGGKGNDDIYSLALKEPLGTQQRVAGVVTDRTTGAPIGGAIVKLTSGGAVQQATTAADGRYSFDVTPGAEHRIDCAAQNYSSSVANLDAVPEVDTTLVKDLALTGEGTVVLWYNVRHAFTRAGLPGVKIDRLDVLKMDTPEKAVTSFSDTKGDHRETLPGVQIGDSIVYYLELHKEGFFPKKGYFRYKVTEWGEVDVHRYMDLCLFPLEYQEFKLTCMDSLDRSGLPVGIGSDLGDVLHINPIYFDLNKDNIRPDAAVELDKVVAAMNEYPTMAIELGSHTDCRGSDASNLDLSDRRAKSSADYIISHGIDRGRITGKGYGETRLKNACADGVKCTEAEHQLNRRTEFIIVKM